ncbi:hypothetical protein HNY73_002667 [Argiope bruennichi]|uniref:Uncharacterized protein n=1 Tax=Argiope bruennichi TaxID=94029 RepID=A0A8T0FUB9_ARGBR|nr:hypothetical protein HNY73_002667 [Argiope bruennichi]
MRTEIRTGVADRRILKIHRYSRGSSSVCVVHWTQCGGTQIRAANVSGAIRSVGCSSLGWSNPPPPDSSSRIQAVLRSIDCSPSLNGVCACHVTYTSRASH